jgi:hypothetical protein
MIDAKDFLDHHHRRPGRGGGVGTIAAQLKIVRSRQFDVFSHGSSICLRVDFLENV